MDVNTAVIGAVVAPGNKAELTTDYALVFLSCSRRQELELV